MSAQQEEPAPASPASPEINLLTPREIYKGLDEYVIGQHKVKVALSVSVHNHYKRVAAKIEKDEKGSTESKDKGESKCYELRRRPRYSNSSQLQSRISLQLPTSMSSLPPSTRRT